MSRERAIDTDKRPRPYRDFAVATHRGIGRFTWNPEQVGFFRSLNQRTGGTTTGSDLHAKLLLRKPLPANVLDYLLAHPDLIPENWKGQYVAFWGTVYHCFGDHHCVRYLHWNGERWADSFHRLDNEWGGLMPAAVLVA